MTAYLYSYNHRIRIRANMPHYSLTLLEEEPDTPSSFHVTIHTWHDKIDHATWCIPSHQ
jgi:hypothetical protein